MGRIDEALRRNSAEAGNAKGYLNTPNQKAFVAPWVALDAEPVQVVAAPSPGTLLDEPRRLAFSGFNPDWVHRLVVGREADAQLVEQFRALAALLHRVRVKESPKVIMVTSADAGEGKTLTAINLSLTLSESYHQRVLLIDADLRRPSIREVSQLGDAPGLSEGLKAASDKKLSVIALSDTLTLLPAGAPDPNPMSSLTSVRMRRIVDEAAERFDWVILDAPPLGPVADASLLSALADTSLLVVRAGRTAYSSVMKAVEALGRDRIFGVVLNGVEPPDLPPHQRYYGGYQASTDTQTGRGD